MSNNKVFIIAEAGVNHNGDMQMAKELIKSAAEIGADAVKFQTFKAADLVVKNAPKAAYQLQSTDAQESQYAMLKKLELSENDHIDLYEYSKKFNIEFMSTPFDISSAEFLLKLGVKRLKIPSGEITNFPFIKKIAQLGLPTLFSTGMSEMEDVTACLNVLLKYGLTKDMISVFHCNTEYPTPFQDVNLRAMMEMKKLLGVKIGYSDHTAGIEVAIAATALGADVIEKHFTLDRELPGPDHKASLEVAEFKQMVSSIRNISLALGSDVKKASPSEMGNKLIVRKSIVAARDIKKGELFNDQNLGTKRPGTGLSPMKWEEVIGKPSPQDFQKDELIFL